MRTLYVFFAFNFFTIYEVAFCLFTDIVFLFFLNFLSVATWISYPFTFLTAFHFKVIDFFLAIVFLIFVAFGVETTAVVVCGFVVVSVLLSGCFCVVGLVTSAFFVVCVESLHGYVAQSLHRSTQPTCPAYDLPL